MIEIDNIHKTYGRGDEAHHALRGVSVSVPTGQIVTFLGPSGCGKSTTLRSLAGLETPDSGRVVIGGRTVFDSSSRVHVPTERRRLGMVFQSYAIWPHMTVAQNVAYPLRAQRTPRNVIGPKVERALALVGLAGLGDRPAPNLSGGQQQRVALARAIVAEPDVLLLDEPLSNLDAKLRDEMRGELRELQRRLRTTMCFVTHDQVEALALSDLVVLMRDGQVIEAGSPRDLYDEPHYSFTARFLGASNAFRSTVVGGSPESPILENVFGRFEARAPRPLAVQDEVELHFRRHDVRLLARAGEHASVGLNAGVGRLRSAQFLGESWQVEIEKNGSVATLMLGAHSGFRAEIGDDVAFEVLRANAFACDESSPVRRDVASVEANGLDPHSLTRTGA